MSFLRPEFLFALPLVALPVIIHLLNRQRYQRVDFAAMEFLRLAMKRTRRRLFLEDLLLLLLRTLAVLFIILALARPGADPGTLLAGRPARGMVLVADASLSMSHRSGGTSAFEDAVSAGLQELADLDPARGDRAALIRAGTEAQRLAFGQPEEVRTALAELDRPGFGQAAMSEALAMALESAGSLSAEGCESVSVVIYTDLQATGWDLQEREGAALREILAAGHQVALVQTGADRRTNVAVTWLEVEPSELSPGEYGEVTSRVRAFGADPPSTVRASLLLDGVPVATEELDLGPGGETTWSYALAPSEIGSRGIELHLERDALAGDDRRAAILPVRPPPAMLLLGEPSPLGEPEEVFDSLRRFLDFGPNAPLAVEVASVGRVRTEQLENADVVILADPDSIPPPLVQSLTDHVDRGGGLLLALGPRADSDDVAALLESLAAPPLSVGPVVEAGSPSARIGILDADHPSVRLFQDPRWQPLLTEVPFDSYRLIEVGEGAGGRLLIPLAFVRETGEATQLDQGPALVEWRNDGGRCALLAASPLPAWNRLVEVPGGALPFLFDLTVHLSPKPSHDLVVEVGGPLEVELPRAPTEVRLLDPEERLFHPADEAEPLSGGRVRQPVLAAAGLPGVWTVTSRVLGLDGGEVEIDERLAVVTPLSESDLTAVPESEILRAVPEVVVREPGSGGILGIAESVSGSKSDLSGFFYLLLAAVLVLETLLAAFLDRRRG